MHYKTVAMKKSILLLFSLIICIAVSAQSRVGKDAVYLKDGGVVRGNIRFADPDSTLYVDTNYGCTFVYSRSEVEHFELNEQSSFYRERGIKITSSLSGGIVFEELDVASDVSLGFNYQFNDWYAAGLDFTWFFLFGKGFCQTPALQLDQRFYFLKKPISPFLELKLGWAIAFVSKGETSEGPVLYEEYYGYENYGRTAELGLGVSLKNVDFCLCTSVSPYKHVHYGGHYDPVQAIFIYNYNSGSYYECIGLSLRMNYSFPIH